MTSDGKPSFFFRGPNSYHDRGSTVLLVDRGLQLGTREAGGGGGGGGGRGN